MNYSSTRSQQSFVDFKTATVQGLADDGGLYMPTEIPKLPKHFFESIEGIDDLEIVSKAMKNFVGDNLEEQQLNNILKETLNFPFPVKKVEENIHVLELFHGPTKAFKDVGARFMSRCLSAFYKGQKDKVTVLVATSGDTGSAVANGFYSVANIEVKILFPEGKISPYQEHQMTSLGNNIQALAIDGNFDDCQALVKQAFKDRELRKKMKLSSANSINVARFLPQMLYYFLAYKQLKPLLKNKKLSVCVPSGNLGNLTAGLFAQQMGLPINQFIAGLNQNDTFYQFLKTGIYKGKKSVPTYANAMDVGDPSNFERINALFGKDWNRIKENISAASFSNKDILAEIKSCFEQNDYLLDPHGAVGKLALQKLMPKDSVGVFLATAAPVKFSEVIQKVIPDFEAPKVDLSSCKKTNIANNYEVFKQILTS